MKAAVTYENGEVFQHFGKTENFLIGTIDSGAVTGTEVVNSNGASHGALAGFLKEQGVQALICGGIGPGAVNALAACGIRVYAGNSGDAEDALSALAAGRLEENNEASCDHHDEGCHHHH